MSESNKFTPGPWLYRGKSNSVHESCSTHPFGHTIFVFDDDAPLRDPDLSLILAAPELLNMLEECSNELRAMIDRHNSRDNSDGSYSYDYQTVQESQDLIAKARGQQ